MGEQNLSAKQTKSESFKEILQITAKRQISQ